jgi:hypothetical protein
MSALEVVAVIAVVVYVIGRQLLGEKLGGKRLVLLPAVLVLVGAGDLVGHGHHPGTADVVMIVIEAVVAAGVGVAQGWVMRLERVDGVLWGQMPRRSLWLWLGLVGSRVVLDLAASGLDAHVAAGTAPVLFTLGINRLAQAGVVAPRALAAGIPFAPERDGTTFLAGVFGESQSHPGPGTSSEQPSIDGRETAAAGRTGPGAGWRSSLGVIAEQAARNRQAADPNSASELDRRHGRSRSQDRRSARRRR